MNVLPAQLVVIAKAPVPGRVKTRLTPPFTPAQAAFLAAAALADTLATGARVPFLRRVLALDDGHGPGPVAPDRPGRITSPQAPAWLPRGFSVTGQSGGGLDERIAAALAGAYARLPVPVVLVGMDTPQLSTALLAAAARALAGEAADAVFGPATDGGYWLLGLRRPDPRLVLGVPMSSASTGRLQCARLHAAGLRVQVLPELTDVDTATDARRVARQAPGSTFAAALRQLGGHPGLSATSQPAGAVPLPLRA